MNSLQSVTAKIAVEKVLRKMVAKQTHVLLKTRHQKANQILSYLKFPRFE